MTLGSWKDRCFAWLWLLCLLPVSNSLWAESEMTIGVLAFRGEQDALDRWVPTAQYLTQNIDGYRFSILPLTLEGMLSRVAEDELDFVLTNTGNYVVLEDAHGISRLATLKVVHLDREVTQFGAVIFTRRDHPALHRLQDIRGHSLMAVDAQAFGGFQMAWRELIEAGVDPFEDLASLQFSGFPQDAIVHAVIAGKVDAGTVRGGTLERMATEGLIDLESIRVLGARSRDDYPVLHSTRLYPEWPFAKARTTPAKLAQRVAIALLQLEPGSEAARRARSAGWTIPLDYGPVHELFRELEIGPYAFLGKPAPGTVWREYRGWIIFSLAMMLVLLALLVVIARANRSISQSELKYRQEANQRKQAQELLAAHSDNLELRVAERTAELADVNESLRRSEAILRAMHDITSASDTSFDDKLASLLAEGCRFFGMEFARVTGAPGDRTLMTYQLDAQAANLSAERARLIECLRREAQSVDQPVAITDLGQHPLRGAGEADAQLAGAAIGTAYLVDGAVAGAILFASTRPRHKAFAHVDIDILQLMAQWLGGEIDRSEINRRSQEHQSHLAHVARLNTMGEMATGIAHELNQPLTAILNYSNGCMRLMQKRDGGRELEEAIGKIGQDARRAAGIIKRLREFIKRGEYQRERFLLRSCIEPAVELLRPRLLQHGIEVSQDYAADAADVVADRIQIEQVVVNLLLNAIDALQATRQASRKIMIRIDRTESGDLSVAVSDSGDALPCGVAEHLFDPFFTTRTEGMGMGLSISRSIVEAHGGTIEYRLNELQQPTFRFTLPAT